MLLIAQLTQDQKSLAVDYHTHVFRNKVPWGAPEVEMKWPPPTLFWCRVVGSVYDPFYKFPKPALTPISHWVWWEEQGIDLFFSSLFSFLTKLFLSLFMWATKCNTMKAFQERLTFIPMFKQLAFHSALQCVKTTCGTNHFLSSVIRPWR